MPTYEPLVCEPNPFFELKLLLRT